MIIILFGLPAAGKNYVGKIFEKYFNFFFYDADDDLTPEMKKAVRQKQLFTDDMRDKYYNNVVQKIKILSKKYDNLVVAQALPKEKYRVLIAQHVPKAKFIFIKSLVKHLKNRLQSRKHIINEQYAPKVFQYFEEPQIKHQVIDNSENDDKEKIKVQIREILKNF